MPYYPRAAQNKTKQTRNHQKSQKHFFFSLLLDAWLL